MTYFCILLFSLITKSASYTFRTSSRCGVISKKFNTFPISLAPDDTTVLNFPGGPFFVDQKGILVSINYLKKERHLQRAFISKIFK